MRSQAHSRTTTQQRRATSKQCLSSSLAQDLEPESSTPVPCPELDGIKQGGRPSTALIYSSCQHGDEARRAGELLYVRDDRGQRAVKITRPHAHGAGTSTLPRIKSRNFDAVTINPPLHLLLGHRRHPLLGLKKMHTG